VKYIIAESVDDVLKAFSETEGKAMVLAGGTDLVLDAESGKKPSDAWIDIMRIPELREIREEGGKIIIGSAVTLTEIARSELIRKYYPSLAKGAGTVGSLQIRNAATLTGNIISAQPAADAAMALAPLDPEIVVVSAEGEKILNMEEAYAGFGKSAIDSSKELVKEVRIRIPEENEKASFIRLELRKSLSLPMLNAAAMAKVENGVIKYIRINMAPVGVGPKRARAAEEFLTGKELNEANAKEAGQLALKDANPRSNPLRGSKEYREATLPVIVERAVMEVGSQLGLV
jgi:CO/xanthine dehydrogenase FAD-binding subunit